MNYYSKNIGKLQNLFSAPSHYQDNSQLANFKESQKYKSLAVLLANAELATQELNKETVKLLLNGEIEWDKKDGTKYKFDVDVDVDVDIELLEQLGMLSFHTGYCSVNMESIQNEDQLDKSVKPYYKALLILRDIIYGTDFIKPHFQIKKKTAKKLLQAESLIFDLDLLNELSAYKDSYKIQLQRSNGKNLFPEYLWQEFFKPFEEDYTEDKPSFFKKDEQTFKKWLLITRVYSEHFLWDLNLKYIDEQRKFLFLQLSLNLIKIDAQLKKSYNTLENQWRCQSQFTEMFFKYEEVGTITTEQGQPKNIQPRPLTVDETHKSLVRHDDANISNLAFTHKWHSELNRQYPRAGLSRFYNYPKKIADSDIYVNNQSIFSRGKLDELHLLANDRPELRHILFNVLHWSCKIDYLLYLLTKKETTTVAVYIFSRPSSSFSHGVIDSTTDSLHHNYFPLVCDEFLNICFNNRYEQLPANEIVELLVILAKEHIHNGYEGETTIAKDCLDMLLNSFSLEHISYFANELLTEITDDYLATKNELAVWKLYLLFWLLEKTQEFNISAKSNMSEDIQSVVCNAYIAFFTANFDNNSQSSFIREYKIFDFLPWWRIKSDSLSNVLDLVPNPAQWITNLTGESKAHFNNKRLIRNYFHLLLCLYSRDRCKKENVKIIEKVIGLLESCGFSNENSNLVAMFDSEHDFGYHLWKKFTLIINDLKNDIFNRTLNVLTSNVSLTRKLDIYSQINKESRKTELLESIQSTPQESLDNLGIKTLEKALNSALYLNQLDLAKTLLDKGLSIINDENSFLNRSQDSYHSLEIKNNWLFYQYETELLSIANNNSLSVEEKKQSLDKAEKPDFSNEEYDLSRNLSNKSSRFRRAVFAMVVYEIDPETSYRYFNQLYKENKDLQHSSNRLASKLAFLDAKKSTVADYQHALSEWEETIKDADTQELPIIFIQNWFHCLEKASKDKKLDALWLELSEKQKNTVEIATIYCKSLMQRKDIQLAKSILDKLRKYHSIEDLGEASENLLKELNELIIKGHEPTIISALTQSVIQKPKTNDDLRRSYQEISAKNILDMIRVIREPETTIEQFLFDQISAIINELQLRKKLLNFTTNDKNPNPFRIINEDPINDWVTSLFDHRNSEIHLSCRDQKRGGESASKKSVGEIDFYICDRNNNRIAIIEAFRLFSNDTTVIFEHLDKIAGYDQECLSPVFIIAYCDVKDFSKLSTAYKKTITNKDYNGFSNKESPLVKDDSATLYTISEIRFRANKPITIYHILVNLRFDN